jgi:hypothetical protein
MRRASKDGSEGLSRLILTLSLVSPHWNRVDQRTVTARPRCSRKAYCLSQDRISPDLPTTVCAHVQYDSSDPCRRRKWLRLFNRQDILPKVSMPVKGHLSGEIINTGTRNRHRGQASLDRTGLPRFVPKVRACACFMAVTMGNGLERRPVTVTPGQNGGVDLAPGPGSSSIRSSGDAGRDSFGASRPVGLLAPE